MAGYVAGIFIAPEAGAPVVSLAAATLIAGAGIEGDRYALGRGHWSDPRWPDQEITLVEAEVAASLGVEPSALRRNLVTSGVCLDALIGATFRIGGATLRGVRPCDPCRYLETLTRPGLARELAQRGGLRAAVVGGGRIERGDAVEVVAPGARSALREWLNVEFRALLLLRS